uniref:Uncharacterized protein n=1 Tax=Oryza sativa subsp. japonica TaxID=39947 RepID=Q6Z8C1_ORYSJ|nr:hypothetical protein [Oryza sativa Japonica Group]
MVEVTEGVPCEHRLNGKAVEAMARTQGGGGGGPTDGDGYRDGVAGDLYARTVVEAMAMS